MNRTTMNILVHAAYPPVIQVFSVTCFHCLLSKYLGVALLGNVVVVHTSFW